MGRRGGGVSREGERVEKNSKKIRGSVFESENKEIY